MMRLLRLLYDAFLVTVAVATNNIIAEGIPFLDKRQQGATIGSTNSITTFLDHRWLAASPTSSDANDCEMKEACRLCDATERSSISECKKTGRVERWQCEITVEGEKEEEETRNIAGAGQRNFYRTCSRTTADEEFLMVRLQVICVLIGTAAFVNARKQKVLSASLFDQRRMGSNQNKQQQQNTKRRRRDSSVTAITPQEIELEEMIPLTEDLVNVV